MGAVFSYLDGINVTSIRNPFHLTSILKLPTHLSLFLVNGITARLVAKGSNLEVILTL